MNNGISEKSNNLSQRLSYFIDKQGENFHKLSQKIGVSNSYFSKMIKSNGSIGVDILEKILLYYENLNPDWLITGRGDMIKSENITNNNVDNLTKLIESNYVLSKSSQNLSESILKTIESNNKLTHTNEKITNKLIEYINK